MKSVPSRRLIVKDAVQIICAMHGYAVRAVDVEHALKKSRCPLDRATIVRALDSLARTGHLVITQMTFGLRSGGRRCYWPAGLPVPQALSPQTSLALIVACIASQHRWRHGARFTARELALALANPAVSQCGALDQGSWQTAFRCLRNLERRVTPLVRRTTVRGKVWWTWMGDVGPTAGRSQRRSQRVALCHETALASGTLAHEQEQLRHRVASVQRATGSSAAPVCDVLDACPTAQRDAMQLAIRGVAHLATKRRQRMAVALCRAAAQRRPDGSVLGEHRTSGDPMPVEIVGWLEGTCYLTTGAQHQDALRDLTVREHCVQARVLAAYCLRRKRERLSTEQVCDTLRGRLALHRVLLEDWRCRAARADAVGEALHRAAATAATGSAWASCLRMSLRTIHAAVDATRADTTRLPGAERGQRRIVAAPAASRITTDALHDALQRLIGSRTPTTTTLRRELADYPIWRTWTRSQLGEHVGHGHRQQPATLCHERDHGREPVLWSAFGALCWSGISRGGPATRLRLRAAFRLIGWSEPGLHTLHDVSRSLDATVALGAITGACLLHPSREGEIIDWVACWELQRKKRTGRVAVDAHAPGCSHRAWIGGTCAALRTAGRTQGSQQAMTSGGTDAQYQHLGRLNGRIWTS